MAHGSPGHMGPVCLAAWKSHASVIGIQALAAPSWVAPALGAAINRGLPLVWWNTLLALGLGHRLGLAGRLGLGRCLKCVLKLTSSLRLSSSLGLGLGFGFCLWFGLGFGFFLLLLECH